MERLGDLLEAAQQVSSEPGFEPGLSSIVDTLGRGRGRMGRPSGGDDV